MAFMSADCQIAVFGLSKLFTPSFETQITGDFFSCKHTEADYAMRTLC